MSIILPLDFMSPLKVAIFDEPYTVLAGFGVLHVADYIVNGSDEILKAMLPLETVQITSFGRLILSRCFLNSLYRAKSARTSCISSARIRRSEGKLRHQLGIPVGPAKSSFRANS